MLDTTPQEVELKAGDGIKELVFFNERLPGIHLIKGRQLPTSPKPIANAPVSVSRRWTAASGPVELHHSGRREPST